MVLEFFVGSGGSHDNRSCAGLDRWIRLPQNDPTAKDAEVTNPDWRISPWTSDWYNLQPWEEKVSGNFYDVVFDRRYGGDLEGVVDELPYLHKLGINAIYFNPLFESPSLHKYNTANYAHIDRDFGPDPKGDLKIMSEENPDDPSTWKWTAADKEFLKLIKKAHSMGMREIIDGVFNHVGTDFWAFRNVEEYQKESPYNNWFDITSFNDPAKGSQGNQSECAHHRRNLGRCRGVAEK